MVIIIIIMQVLPPMIESMHAWNVRLKGGGWVLPPLIEIMHGMKV